MTNNINEGNHDARLGVVLRDKGNEAMRVGQVQMAIQFYSQALRHEVTIPLLCHRADAYLQLEMYNDVIHDCTKIIGLQPKIWRAYVLRAAALREQCRFVEAMVDLKVAKMLCPKRANHFERLRMKCRRQDESIKQVRHFQVLIEEGSKLAPRPFFKGDKHITCAQIFLKMMECFQVINRVLEEPGIAGAIIWKEDELDRWRRVRTRNNSATKSTNLMKNHDSLVIVERLKELQCFLHEGGHEMRKMMGQTSSFSTLLAVYEHQELMVLEILYEALQDGDDLNIRAFLQAQPLHILARSFQDPCQLMRSITCALLDLVASFKAQKILTFMMQENLLPMLLKLMHFGSTIEHATSVSLFFKLALDPRLGQQLSRLSSLQDLCGGLSRACGAGKQITRLQGVQAITTLLNFEKMRQTKDSNVSREIIPLEVLIKEPYDITKHSLSLVFAEGGVLRAIAFLLARESKQAPEMTNTFSSIWEEDLELICEEITTTINEFSEECECTLRDFKFMPGYAQILAMGAIRAMDFMAHETSAINILDHAHAWGLFVPLLCSFPNKLATLSAKTLATFCAKSSSVAMQVANVWPINSSLIVLELACSAHHDGDSQTYEAAILILSKLAGYKSFSTSMERPASFTMLLDFLQDGKCSTMTLEGICICLAKAMTSCNICVEIAEAKAYALGSRLLQLWCEYRAQNHLRWQIENLMFILMDKSFILQQAILCLLENGNPYVSANRPLGKDMTSCNQISYLTSPKDENAAERYLSFTQNRMNFQQICFFLSNIFHPSTKFVDLCAGSGLMSIQLAKHFKDIHCYAVTRKRTWMEHTRRLAKHEAVQNLTPILSKTIDHLPNTLPSSLDVAILCLSLDVIQDLGRLYCSIRAKLQQKGKLVLIDDNEELMIEARMQAGSYGLDVVLQSTMAEQYLLLVLQRTIEF